MVMYRDCEIENGSYAWEWSHKDYCGPDDCLDVQLFGHAKTLEQAKSNIDEMHEDLDAEQMAEDFAEDMRNFNPLTGEI